MAQELVILIVIVVIIFICLNMNSKDTYEKGDYEFDSDDLSEKCRLCLENNPDGPKKCKHSCLKHRYSDNCAYCLMVAEKSKKCIPFCVGPN
jgi:hypothetical protein